METEEETDKTEFVFTEFREGSDKMDVEVWGSEYNQKVALKLKGKVTDTVGWKNQRLVKG